MHTQLLNIGFIKQPDGSYFNNELGMMVTIADDNHIWVKSTSGIMKATIKELEDAIISGGFGEY